MKKERGRERVSGQGASGDKQDRIYGRKGKKERREERKRMQTTIQRIFNVAAHLA